MLDLISTYIIWYFLVPFFSFCAVGVTVLKYSENIRRKVFSKIYKLSSPYFFDHMDPEKEVLFSQLKKITSHDKDLRDKGLIRVLEVGAGPGNNFKFFPKNMELIILEPNKYFEEKRNENLKQYPGIEISRTILGKGENMKDIEDNSMDAVVGTFLHCSVEDVSDVLKEIQRVLAPGGKYFFMEHSCGSRGIVKWRFQNLINPLWKIVFDGCQIVKNAPKTIKNSGLFEEVEAVLFNPPPKVHWFLAFCMGPASYGTAEKAK